MIKINIAKWLVVFVAIVELILFFGTGKVWAKSEVAPKMKKIKSWGQVFTG